jgi:hypothetical protein
MTIFRWIMGAWVFGLGGVSVFCFVVYMSTGIDLWVDRARKLRRLAWAAALFWFNLEIWGRVVWIIIHWKS